jgi:hypothetical protein
MSFGRPPFEGVFIMPDTTPKNPQRFKFECDGCGYESGKLYPTEYLGELWTDYMEHLRKSHNLVPPCGAVATVHGESEGMQFDGDMVCVRETHGPSDLHQWTWKG